MIKIQVTLFDVENRYKPVSTLIEVESVSYYNEHAKEELNRAIKYIRQKRGWTIAQLREYGYTDYKIRVYKERVRQNKRE